MNDAADRTAVVVHTAPDGEPLSEYYSVSADGASVPVYCCRVSAVPLNQLWPGYQRPLDQTELAAFAYFDASGPVTVEVASSCDIESVEVRPLSAGITPVADRRRISFEVSTPRYLTVEVNGSHHALHLFISPPESNPPTADDANCRYFGPGIHRPGKMTMASNQTVYVAAGAVVYGSIHAKGASNLRISGRGVIDVSEFERSKGGGAIRLEDCRDVMIDGVVLRDPDIWCCSLFGCRDVEISDLKLIGLWRYNSDGIDVCNSQNVHIRDCFVRAYDDCIVLKGLDHTARGRDSYHDRPVRNILVERCTVWNDWGRALQIGAETSAPEFTAITFRDCDIIRTTHNALGMQHGDRALVHNIRYESIRVEYDDFTPRLRMQESPDETYVVDETDDYQPYLMSIIIAGNCWSRDNQQSTVRNVVYKDISVTSKSVPPSEFIGADAACDVADITIDNLRVNGRPCTDAAAANLTIHSHVSGVTLAGAPVDGSS